MLPTLRNDFPLLTQTVNGKKIIFFDNAATTQKPQLVIESLANFYARHCAPVHRSMYTLGEQATTLYEEARARVAQFINARLPREIVFTRNTTESINLIAATWATAQLRPGDQILLTELEHHSNMVPWQRLAHEKQLSLLYLPINQDGTLQMELLDTVLTSAVKLVAVTHTSNALGTHVDVETITQKAHGVGAKILVDAAQSIAHETVDVQKINCDFLAFSGHKLFGPTGVGVLYINQKLHKDIPAYQVGGGMIYEADFMESTYLQLPQRLEAGTPAIAQVVGLAAAIDYVTKNLVMSQLQQHEAALCRQLIDGLQKLPRIRILGPVEELATRGHLVSFIVDGMHAHDVAAYLDTYGICVRAGHHCAQPVAKKLGLDAAVRVSFTCYNTQEEVAQLLYALKRLI